MTPLMEAAKQGAVDAAKVLVDFGADVNVKDKTDRTALHYACAGMKIVILMEGDRLIPVLQEATRN